MPRLMVAVGLIVALAYLVWPQLSPSPAPDDAERYGSPWTLNDFLGALEAHG